jgi:murein L,D-transpeptidase YafK
MIPIAAAMAKPLTSPAPGVEQSVFSFGIPGHFNGSSLGEACFASMMRFALLGRELFVFSMRRLLFMTCLTLLSCRGQEEGSTTTMESESSESPLPGPARAAAAAKRVTPELSLDLDAKGLHFGDPVFLRAFKEEKQLELWVRHRESKKFVLFRSYPIAASSGDLGPKLAEGDGQVPEGFYYVPKAKMKPDSTYHLAFNIGYPNSYDRHHGRTGSFIMIHGNQVSIGCLAMTDTKIEEIYTLCDAALGNGQKFFRIHIFPFRMSDERLASSSGNNWHAFWMNLKQGYDFFEKSHLPPEVTVKAGRYEFE